MSVTQLDTDKVCIRRVGLTMVKIDIDGVWIKGYRKRKWRLVPFAKLARLACEIDPPAKGFNDAEWGNCLKAIGAKL